MFPGTRRFLPKVTKSVIRAEPKGQEQPPVSSRDGTAVVRQGFPIDPAHSSEAAAKRWREGLYF